MIWAAAAVGVSHLVQSTRAGADFGLQMIGVVLLANLFKYPFFSMDRVMLLLLLKVLMGICAWGSEWCS